MKKMMQYIKNSYLYKEWCNFYSKVLSMLSKHKGIPSFFAHGGLHLFAFALFLAIVIGMGLYVWNSNVASFNQIVYTFYGDTLQNYRLSHLSFEKDMTRREDNIVNEKDIVFRYGYTLDSTINNPRKVFLKDSCDLHSIVKYVTCNNIPDTLLDYKNAGYKFYSLKQQFKKTVWISNHERYYHVLSTVKDSTHLISQQTNARDHVIDWGSINPNYSFWIGINMPDGTVLDKNSYIKIKFNDIRFNNSDNGIENPMIVEKVVPQPTKMDIKEILFRGDELQAVVNQKGIYISGVDTIKRDEAERKNIRNTVLLGTFIAILFDIFIQLIQKWRKLRRQK